MLMCGGDGHGVAAGVRAGRFKEPRCFSEGGVMGQQRTSNRKNDRGSVQATQRSERRSSKAQCWNSPGEREVERATERWGKLPLARSSGAGE